MARLSEQSVSRAKERVRSSRPERKRYYRLSNSETPIPARASAFPRPATVVRRRYSRIPTDVQKEQDVTCISTVPPSVVYQHESPGYEAESSLSYLSLVASEYAPLLQASPSIDELDTFDELETPQSVAERWQGELPIVHAARRVEQQAYCEPRFPLDIAELATNPPPVLGQANSLLALCDEHYHATSIIDDVIAADTVPSNVLMGREGALLEDVEHVVHEVYRPEAREQNTTFEYKPAFVQHPFDFVRWWLLSPGRLEFLFWLAGGVLLGVVMCALLLVTGISTGFMSLGHGAH